MLMPLVAACSGDSMTSTSNGDSKLVFFVENKLLAPVTIAIDSVLYASISGGGRTGLTVPSTAQWLIWRSAEPLDNSGRVIRDDLGDVAIQVHRINSVLEITNVVDYQTYITGSVFNTTTTPVSIGVYDGVSVSCVAALPARSLAAVGFVQFGYYRLLPATEVRAYHDPSTCTGPYQAWPRAALNDFEPKSGAVVLVLESAP